MINETGGGAGRRGKGRCSKVGSLWDKGDIEKNIERLCSDVEEEVGK